MNRYKARRWALRWFNWIGTTLMGIQCVWAFHHGAYVSACFSAGVAGVLFADIRSDRRIRQWRQIANTWKKISIKRASINRTTRRTLEMSVDNFNRLANLRFQEATAHKPLGTRNAPRGQA